MCGTLKQEVDTEEEEAVLFDNTKMVQRHQQILHTQNAHTDNKREKKKWMQKQRLNLYNIVFPEDILISNTQKDKQHIM